MLVGRLKRLQAKLLGQGLDQGDDGGFGSFEVGRVAEVAQGLGGDGADGGAEDGFVRSAVCVVRREGEASGVQEGEKICGGGGASEGNGVGPGGGVGEEGLEEGNGVVRDEVAIGGGDGEIGSGGAEGGGESVAGVFGADEEQAGFAGDDVGEEGLGEGFGYGLRGQEIGGEADLGEGSGGGGADSGDLWVLSCGLSEALGRALRDSPPFREGPKRMGRQVWVLHGGER